MSVNAASAVAAYKNAAQQALSGDAGSKVSSEGSFGDMVKDALQGAAETMKASEEMSLKAAFNDASMVDVVAAVSAAEVTLQTVVSVRDKMIQAYQEILRMPM